MKNLLDDYVCKIVEGRLVTHAHDKFNWRLRDMINHPRDPSWETGRYSTCHELFRLNPKLQTNTMVFDLVRQKGKKFPVIRSAFLIEKLVNGVLYFDSFYFSDGEPLETPHNLFRTSYGKKLTRKESITILTKMMNNSYKKYDVGAKPKSIGEEDWRRMVAITITRKLKRHRCN